VEIELAHQRFNGQLRIVHVRVIVKKRNGPVLLLDDRGASLPRLYA
jgi:hypothetical protein